MISEMLSEITDGQTLERNLEEDESDFIMLSLLNVDGKARLGHHSPGHVQAY